MLSRITLVSILILILVMGAAFVMGCEPEEVVEEPVEEPEEPVDEPEEPVDEPEEEVQVAVIYSISDPERAGGWDRAQFVGHQKLEEEYGWEVSIAEDVPFAELASVATEFAERDYDMVLFSSSGHTEAWMEVAPQYPDTWFMMMSVATSPDRLALEDAISKHECEVINSELLDVTHLNSLCEMEGDEIPKNRTLTAILLEMGYDQIEKKRIKIRKTGRCHYVWYRCGVGDSTAHQEKVRDFHEGAPPF